MIIILDNGHGKDTPGKRSPIWPDGNQLFEFEFNRSIVSMLSIELLDLHIYNHILVPEIYDVDLKERCRRVNNITKFANKEALLISIHGNAGGGTGWECFTTKGNTKSDDFATLLYQSAKVEFPEKKMRFDYTDKDPDKEADFYILKNTICPAVLTENFFMDNEADCKLMMSEDGQKRIVDLHVNAIKAYLR